MVGNRGKGRAMGASRRIWSDDERSTFEKLCGIFCTKSEVCCILEMDPKTLDKNIAESYPETPTWAEAFELFSGEGRAALRRQQFQTALEGSVPMLIFLGKNYLGQSDQGLKSEQKPDVSAVGKLVSIQNRARYGKAANA